MLQLSLANVKSRLQRAGFKMTPQREATVEVLMKNEAAHLSAEEIFMFLKQTHPDIGLATVYRTLDILTQLNVIKKLVFVDGIARYDLKREESGHLHHHLLCIKCGEIEEVFADLLSNVEKQIEAEFQFKILDHRLTFHGICRKCQSQRTEDMAHG